MKKLLTLILMVAVIFTFTPMISGATQVNAATSINAPTEFYGSGTKDSVKLSWSKVKGASQFVIYKGGEKLKTVEGTSFTDKKVKVGKVYSYKVQAKSGSKKSSFTYTIKIKAQKNVNVKRVTMNFKSKSIALGKTVSLKATITPSREVLSKKVIWTSSNSEIASVSSTGKVTAKGAGDCKVIARAHSGKVATCAIKVTGAADYVIEGTIKTEDKGNRVVEAAAVKDGKFIYVGSKVGAKKYINKKTEIVSTEDGMALPSFTDGHAHGYYGGVNALYNLRMYSGTSNDEYLGMVAKFVADHPEAASIKGIGWKDGCYGESGPLAADLDKISTDVPIVLTALGAHSLWCNSKAMEMAGVDKNTADPGGNAVIERDADGNPTGTFREGAAMGLINSILPDYTVEQYKNGILRYQEEYMQYGITAYFEPMANNSKNLLQAYNELDAEGKMLIHCYGGFRGNVADAVEAKNAAAGGDFEITAVKVACDGVVEGHTAWLLEPYADDPSDYGTANWTQDDLNAYCLEANQAGLSVHTHAIGDAASHQILNALEYAYEQTGAHNMRNAITHLQLITEEDIAKMAKLDVIAVPQPYWHFKEDGYFDALEVPYLGEERANNEYPMQSFFDNDVVVSSGSDYSATNPAIPLEGIQIGATRCSSDGDTSTLLKSSQRATVEEMIKSFTYNGAYQNSAEKVTGSIEVGKDANFILLNKDITKINKFDISSASILRTYYEGELIYKAETEK